MNRITNIVLIVTKLIYKQQYSSNTKKILALMKVESCIILKLFLNFSDSEPGYSYKLYSLKSVYLPTQECFYATFQHL